MTAESKLRAAASADATLQVFFGTNPFRWWHEQLLPGFVMKPVGATCATVQQISTGYLFAQEGRLNLMRPRFQIIVRDPNADVVDNAAAAIVDWLSSVSFTDIPGQNANFVLDVRPGLDYELKPTVPTQLIDFKIWNMGII